MDQTTNTGFLKQNRGLEFGLMVLGLVLFIALGVRGLQRIGDMRVAAGERNKLTVTQASDKTSRIELPKDPLYLLPVTPATTSSGPEHKPENRNKHGDQAKSQKVNVRTGPNENASDSSNNQSAKRQNS